MARKRHRGPTLGSIIHRDSSGRKVGYSERNILGGYVDYDRHGRIVGHSEPDNYGGYDHYDGWGNPAGHSASGEYVHNPQDNLFKTGSYNYKEKRTQSAYTSSPSSHPHDFSSGEIPSTQPVHKETSVFQAPKAKENNISDYQINYEYVKKQFLGYLFASLSCIISIGSIIYYISGKKIALTILWFLIMSFFAYVGLSSDYENLKVAKRLWMQEKNKDRIAAIPKEKEEKKKTQKKTSAPKVVSDHTKFIPKHETSSNTSSNKADSKKKLKKPQKSLWHRITKSKHRKILLLKTGLAGSQFYIKDETERAKLQNIQPGTELILRREPDNKHDEWAVAVYLTEDDKIGFMSRYKNETIARLMDAGKKCVAIADDPAEQNNNDNNRSRQAPTENMYLPFSVYFLEDM